MIADLAKVHTAMSSKSYIVAQPGGVFLNLCLKKNPEDRGTLNCAVWSKTSTSKTFSWLTGTSLSYGKLTCLKTPKKKSALHFDGYALASKTEELEVVAGKEKFILRALKGQSAHEVSELRKNVNLL